MLHEINLFFKEDRIMFKRIFGVAVLFLAVFVILGPSRLWAQEKKTYSIGIVPQFQVGEIFEKWTPFLKKLSAATGAEFEIKPYTNFKQFEEDLYKGVPDFVYINPYEAMQAKERQGYIPLVKDKEDLVGILVVHKGKGINSVKDLNGKELAFPSPNAFAASLYLRALLTEKEKIRFTPFYAKTHGNVYRTVILDKAAAGGGVVKTLSKEPNEIKNQLAIIYETHPTASHPIAAHPRVPESMRKKVATAILNMASDKSNEVLMKNVQIPNPMAADYQKDYLPLKKLSLMLEKYTQNE